MKIVQPFLLLAALVVGLATHALATEPAAKNAAPPLEHRGFQFVLTGIEDAELATEVQAAVKEQIDIVCAVGLPPRILDFFRKVPLSVVGFHEGTPGRYAPGKKVELSVGIVAYRNRPVLLHEYLHAFHDQQLSGGVRNEEIRTYYQRAKQKDVYAAKSHMMANVQEFFACSATTYLAGSTGQEPFLRDKVRTNQGQFFEHLKTMFGPEAGKYEGSREPPDMKRLQTLRAQKKAPTPPAPGPAVPGDPGTP